MNKKGLIRSPDDGVHIEAPQAQSLLPPLIRPFSSRGAEVKRGAMALRSYLSEQVGYNPASTSKIVII